MVHLYVKKAAEITGTKNVTLLETDSKKGMYIA